MQHSTQLIRLSHADASRIIGFLSPLNVESFNVIAETGSQGDLFVLTVSLGIFDFQAPTSGAS